MGNILAVAILCKNHEEVRERTELICELMGGEELRSYLWAEPRVKCELKSVDWQIIDALKSDPLASHSIVAERLPLSSRTVTRRIARLIESNLFFFYLDIDFSRLDGASCVSLFLDYSDEGFKDRIERSIFKKFEDFVLVAGWGNPNHGYFEFLVPNASFAQEIEEWAGALRGVIEAK